MRVSLMIEGQEGVSWEEWVALASACEEHGFEGLFRSDHYASVMGDYSRGSLDAWATIVALAACTERIRLGSLVSPSTFRHPSELARVVVTADHVSGGRVELGLGAGWHELEHRMSGFPFADRSTRLERFAEQLEIIHRQWTEESFDFAGEHYRLEGTRALPKPVQRPHPPLIVGGGAKRGTVEPAVRWADEYNTVFASPATIRERRRALDEACERTGRDPDTLPLSLMTVCIVGADEEEVRERAGRVAAVRGEAGGADAVLESQRETGIVGTVAQVRERLEELESAGARRVFLEHLDHRDLAMVDLIGRELLDSDPA